MYKKLLILSVSLYVVYTDNAAKSVASFKDQYCTDPRTMRRHAAYTEWADAYSCTRHRCQPGGRNLAIYTVGCKRVEAPESAIECEEVVEDTNMQFPFCCTRLRCLVVVRGEVWTKVLGQPWETLPAAPWSHMYKMKKPPPGDSVVPKSSGDGPVYELSSDTSTPRDAHEALRARKSPDNPDCDEATPRAVGASPDIVIALTTNEKEKSDEKRKTQRQQHSKTYDDDNELEKLESEVQDPHLMSSKIKNHDDIHMKASLTEIPQNQWTDAEPLSTGLPRAYDSQEGDKTEEKTPFNLQALVDAIGTRMRDIEDVVQRMSDKVHQGKKTKEGGDNISAEKKTDEPANGSLKRKKPYQDQEYKRFTAKSHASKYLRTATEGNTEGPTFVEDNSLKGYFSDASNSVLRKNGPKEPQQPTYMAPIETRRRKPLFSPINDMDLDKKRKRKHKKKRPKMGHVHKKTRRPSKPRKMKKTSSETEMNNAVSLEDSAMLKKR